jgi:type II secretory pathway component PulF
VLRLPGLARCRERATPEICRGLATLLKGGLDLPSALLMLRDMVETSRSARRSAAPPRRSARAGG